eukprot:CAMPEP_0178409654 /NCGR_PEP_ID=MMETSP0689_2-20121128/20573_1 /TAXON_ID=160604 /ORGANISM="Amphidinium massartii, Strain CS-259" /LENGTH=165 /DNA_ID=CAMNT_0020030801 /DNA_START=162 /DNA_END=659 /DNA_ORIENTATION=-
MAGLQEVKRRDVFLPGKSQKDGSYIIDFEVTVSGEEIGRPGYPKFGGTYVFGDKFGRFAKFMLMGAGRQAAKKVPLRGIKILLTHNATRAARDTKQWITMDMARKANATGGVIFADVHGPHTGACSTPILGNGWKVVPAAKAAKKQATAAAAVKKRPTGVVKKMK